MARRAKPTKPKPKTIPSDDCEVTVDGVDYYPHRGEWIKAIPALTVAEVRLRRELTGVQVKLDALKGEPDENEQMVALMDDSFDTVIRVLSQRIVEWDWTDDAAEPYPQPHRNPEVLRSLRMDELYYLVLAVRGETAGERKNASRPSQTPSSATGQQPSQT